MRTSFLFILFCLLTITIGEAATYYLNLNDLMYQSLSEQLTTKQIEAYLTSQSKWKWLTYVLLPLVLFLKFTVLSWIIGMGAFFSDLTIPHWKLFRAVIIAELIFFVPALIKIGVYILGDSPDNLLEFQQYYPLSLQSIVVANDVPKWAIYPYQLANVFEVLYWVVLGWMINIISGKKNGFSIVLTSYLPALFLWMIFIMFLSLNYPL